MAQVTRMTETTETTEGMMDTKTTYCRGVLKEQAARRVCVPLTEGETDRLHRDRARALSALRSAEAALQLAQSRYRQDYETHRAAANDMAAQIERGVKTVEERITLLWDARSWTVTTVGADGVQITHRDMTEAERAHYGPLWERAHAAASAGAKASRAARKGRTAAAQEAGEAE